MRPHPGSPTLTDDDRDDGGNLSAGPSAPASDATTAPNARPTAEPWWRRWPRVAYECTVMLGGYLYFAVFGISISVVCWPLSFLLSGRRPGVAHACQGVIRRGFAIFLAYIDAAGIVKVEFTPEVARLREMRGTILAPNHPCLLDAVFLISRLPRVTCIMKRAVLHNPALGGTARLAGYLCNDSGPNFVRRCRDALQRGDCLLIFPEGTRTRPENRPLNPCRMGFALIATLAGAPVQTVFIETPSDYLGKRWPILRKPTLPVRFRITLGERFEPRPGVGAKELGAEVDRYFRENLAPDREGVKRRRKAEGGRRKDGSAESASPTEF